MLTKFAAALIATSLVAGSAFAAQPSGNSGATPAAQTTQTASHVETKATKTATTHKAVKTAKNRSAHARKHLASGNSRMVHHARHIAPAKTHQAGIGKSAKHS
jgi:hypothetical protein